MDDPLQTADRIGRSAISSRLYPCPDRLVTRPLRLHTVRRVRRIGGDSSPESLKRAGPKRTPTNPALCHAARIGVLRACAVAAVVTTSLVRPSGRTQCPVGAPHASVGPHRSTTRELAKPPRTACGIEPRVDAARDGLAFNACGASAPFFVAEAPTAALCAPRRRALRRG